MKLICNTSVLIKPINKISGKRSELVLDSPNSGVSDEGGMREIVPI